MRDHEHRLVFAKCREGRLDQRLVFGVGERRCFVENHNWGVFQNGTRKRDALTLSPGKVHARFSHHGVHAIGELGDDVVALCRIERREHLGITRIGATRTYVVRQASLEQPIVLEHEGNGAHQLLDGNASHIRPAHKNDTLICVPKARDERRERRLASARRPDESHRRPGGNGKRYVAKRRFPGPRIREADARKLDARLLRMKRFRRLLSS